MYFKKRAICQSPRGHIILTEANTRIFALIMTYNKSGIAIFFHVSPFYYMIDKTNMLNMIELQLISHLMIAHDLQ